VAALSGLEEPFLRHVTSHNYATGGASVPIDFLDVHVYGMPAADWRPLLERYGLKGLPIYYTEWGVSSWWNHPVNDMAYGAAWIAHGLHASLDQVTVISYWTASDYFEERRTPKKFFYGGFGLIGIDGIRKPRYWAYYLLHQLGKRRVALEGDGDGLGGLVTGWATRDDDGSVRVLFSNVTEIQTQAEGNPLLSRHVSLTVAGLPPGRKFRLQHFRVDNTHSNVQQAWQAMGQPDWPSNSQLAELHRGDALEMLEPGRDLEVDASGQCAVQFEMPMPSLSLLVMTPVE
jgi:xylan 1,4-beta-xylosidase